MNTTFPSNDVAVLGIPTDENSSFMRGPVFGPQRIRESLFSGASNMTTEQGFDLEANDRWVMVGDIDLQNGTAVQEKITVGISDLLNQDLRVLSLGGDHSITYLCGRLISSVEKSRRI